MFVIVLAAGQHGDALAAHMADQQVASMAGNAAAGKALELGIGNGDPVFHQLANGRQAGAQHEGGRERLGTGNLADGLGGFGHFFR